MGITWMTAFLDTTEDRTQAAEEFWAGVTGWPVGPRRGPAGEFATLEPPEGDALVKVQVVGEPPPGGIHLDLHTDDVEALAGDVERLGGSTEWQPWGYVVCRSPAGLVFCLVEHGAARRPHATRWEGGDSLVDQLSLDIPAAAFETEVAFWASLTGWERRSGSLPQFDHLLRPPGLPLRLLLQRLDDGPSAMHVDIASEHREAEVERHVRLGAEVVRVEEHWTTLVDPSGRTYCITDRDPGTGLLP